MNYCVYFLFKGDDIIYIGMTNNLKRRLNDHGQGWFDRYRFISCRDKQEAYKYEQRWIRRFKPSMNAEPKTEKETVSFKLEKDYRLALEKEARKKEWTLSYFIQSIVNQHVKKNKLV